jgi:uncharacterized integral membrane protein
VEVIPVNFLVWRMEISKLLLIVITLLTGMILGMMIPGLLSPSKKKEANTKAVS